jgi:outer membrane protein OmpA-like peptidoglycan-associated protein
MRRILLPAGYGTRNPEVSNKTSEGRESIRGVDVKMIINKGIAESAI